MPQSPADACRSLVATLARVTKADWTFGYIGNCGPGYDDRVWCAFRAHPGRVGTANDRIGGVSTDRLPALADMLRGAVARARITTT